VVRMSVNVDVMYTSNYDVILDSDLNRRQTYHIYEEVDNIALYDQAGYCKLQSHKQATKNEYDMLKYDNPQSDLL